MLGRSIWSFRHPEHHIHPLLMQWSTAVGLEKMLQRRENRERRTENEEQRNQLQSLLKLLMEGGV